MFSEREPVPIVNFAGGWGHRSRRQVILRAIDPYAGPRGWEHPMTDVRDRLHGNRRAVPGRRPGHSIAPEARSGRHRGRCSFGERLVASPIVHEGHSKQYVAVASAAIVTAFGLFEPCSRWSRLRSYSASS